MKTYRVIIRFAHSIAYEIEAESDQAAVDAAEELAADEPDAILYETDVIDCWELP